MEKINFQAEFKKLTATKGRDSMRMEITPFRDWRIVVIIFLVGITAAIGFGVYMLIQINQETFFSAPPVATGIIKFNEDGLMKVIKTIDDKSAKFEAAKTATSTVVDPSR